MIRAFSASLSLRLLGIFIVTAILIITILISLSSRGLKGQWRRSIQPHLVQYVLYVQQDLGSPPQLEKAKALASTLPVAIYIYRGSQFQFSTTTQPLAVSTLSFRPLANRLLTKNARELTDNGLTVYISGHGNPQQGILKIEENGYTVYYDLHAIERRSGHATHRNRLGNELFFALLALTVVLAGSYLLIRQQLSPIRQIQKSVRRMADADLDHRIDRHGRGDLDVLAQSIDSMAGRIQAMLDAKRQLLIAISHELRSPLTRARITTELLPGSTNRDRLLEDLIDMERMITDIMESEQLQHSHAVLNPETLDIAALLDDELVKLAPEQRIQQASEDIPIIYHGDAARLRILLRNLVRNALQHGKSSDGQTHLSVTLSESPDYIELAVQDEGPGIDSQHLQQVADPFYRPDASRSRATGGFGLGLTLARLIAEAHGGSLHIHSDAAQGAGTRVCARLPRNSAAPVAPKNSGVSV